MSGGAFRGLALFTVVLVLFACTALLLRRISGAQYAGLDRYRQSDAELASNPAPERVVFFGDSITDGWDLATSFPGRPYVNRGINGQTTSQLLLRFHQDVVNLRPESVVILAGINDIRQGVPVDQVESNLAGIAEMAAANHLRVYFGSVLPVGTSYRKYGPANIAILNHWLREYSSRAGAAYIDYWHSLADQNGILFPRFTNDGLHPNAAGYAVMTEVFDREFGLSR